MEAGYDFDATFEWEEGESPILYDYSDPAEVIEQFPLKRAAKEVLTSSASESSVEHEDVRRKTNNERNKKRIASIKSVIDSLREELGKQGGLPSEGVSFKKMKNSEQQLSKEKVLAAALFQLQKLRMEKEARDNKFATEHMHSMPVLKPMTSPGVSSSDRTNFNTWAFQYGSLASFVYFWGDRNPRVVACNRSFCRLLGLPLTFEEPRVDGEAIRWTDLLIGRLRVPIGRLQPCLDELYDVLSSTDKEKRRTAFCKESRVSMAIEADELMPAGFKYFAPVTDDVNEEIIASMKDEDGDTYVQCYMDTKLQLGTLDEESHVIAMYVDLYPVGKKRI